MSAEKTFTAMCIILILLLPFFSCAGKHGSMGKYGHLQDNESLRDTYHKKNPLPDFDYYYTGRSGLPYAVIGIDKGYNLRDWHWVKIENRAGVYDKIAHIDDRPGVPGVYSYVFFADIVSAAGGRVGIWFSYYAHTVIKVDSDTKAVAVFSPYSPNESNEW